MRFVLNTERLIKLNYILIIHVITVNIALYEAQSSALLIISWEKPRLPKNLSNHFYN